MPGARVFIDSTTFLYAIQPADVGRRKLARMWLTLLTETDAGVTNLQVLNEVTSVLTRKARKFDGGDPFMQVDGFADFGTEPIGIATVGFARELHRRYAYSWWDCLLLASALELGCSHFLSEDLQDGQVIEGLTIVDPFAHSPDQILALR
jgi:predicted nucleic acid-binding protein